MRWPPRPTPGPADRHRRLRTRSPHHRETTGATGSRQQGGVDADRRDEVHRAAHGLTEDDLGTKDRPRPASSRLLLPEVVLLQEVEVAVRVAGPPLPRRNRRDFEVNPVGLGALQERDVLESGVPGRQGLEEVLQHAEVGLHLVVLQPSLHQPRLLVQGGVHEVADIAELADHRLALRTVGQIHRPQGGAGHAAGYPAGQAHHVPVAELGKVPHRGQPHQARCAGDDDPLGLRLRVGHGRHRRTFGRGSLGAVTDRHHSGEEPPHGIDPDPHAR